MPASPRPPMYDPYAPAPGGAQPTPDRDKFLQELGRMGMSTDGLKALEGLPDHVLAELVRVITSLEARVEKNPMNFSERATPTGLSKATEREAARVKQLAFERFSEEMPEEEIEALALGFVAARKSNPRVTAEQFLAG
jgi:hypothetical protein